MKLLAIEKSHDVDGKTISKSILKEEAAEVWKLYKEGIIREIYFTEHDNRAVLVLESENEEMAKSILNQLPLVKENQIIFDILPLKAYDGFERLFNPE